MNTKQRSVAGANRGIGYSIAEALSHSSKPYTILVGSRDIARGEEAVSKLVSAKTDPDTTISQITIDVTSSESIKSAIQTISGKYGRLDILINNAGVGVGPQGSATTRDDWRHIFEINVFGAMEVTISSFDLLRKSAEPKVVVVSSSMGSISLGQTPIGANGSPYSASKAAINQMLAQWTLTEKDIKFWGVCPGLVATDFGGDFTRNNGRPVKEAVDIIRQCVEGERDDGIGRVSWEDSSREGGTGIYPW